MIRLINIQNELKAPKGQYNSFGKYKYRSCEDIIEAVKPICLKHKAVITLSDELVVVGDRYYVKATATIFDTENGIEIARTTAYAREDLEKKGMDGSQITGTASSYARKYALNGLLQIDDTKDADTDEYVKIQDKTDYKDLVFKHIESNKLDKVEFCKQYKLNAKSTQEDFKRICDELNIGGNK